MGGWEDLILVYLPVATMTHPALRYFGSKWRIAPWIISFFPPHGCYVEPFGGGGSVLLRKPPARYEIYNDLDGEVVNFFRVLRERSDELLRAIALTPYSHEEQELSFEPDHGDELERARRLYVRAWQTIGGSRTQWKSGWRRQYNNSRHQSVVDDWNLAPEALKFVVRRLKQVQIERGDAFRLIEKVDGEGVLFYLDPPYMAGIVTDRWSKKAYQHEMEDADHVRLAELLRGIRGMAIVSGYPSDLYDELYRGWQREERTTLTQKAAVAHEVLWISPRVSERRRQLELWRS